MLMYAYSLCRSWAIAEELVQNTFVKAFLIPDLECTNIKSWIIKVMRNEYIDMIRKNKRLVSIDNYPLHTDDSTLSNMIIKDRFKIVSEEIRKLPDKYRQVIEMSAYMKMTDREIALVLNTSEENVRQIRSRGRKKLKENIKEIY